MSEGSLSIDDGALRLEHGSAQVDWLSARALREACRCAHCTARARRGEPVVAPADLRVVDLRPVGAYAAQLVFSDGHDRGIYPFAMLDALRAARA
ncbi:MAG: DUF971 domain-containing protein [Polyangiales bacterium]